MPHGFSQVNWDLAKKKLATRLIENAKRKGKPRMPYYSKVLEEDIAPALAPDIKNNPLLEPLRYHADPRFEQLIYEVLEEYYNEFGIFLTVLLVHKDGDQRPGGNFFTACEHLQGEEITDRDEFWLAAVQAVFKHFEHETVK